MNKAAEQGKKGFLIRRKNKVLRHLMHKNNVTLHAISTAFELTEQRATLILEDIYLMKFKHFIILSVLFNIDVGLLVSMLYRGQTQLSPEKKEEHKRNMDMLEQEILKGDLI